MTSLAAPPAEARARAVVAALSKAALAAVAVAVVLLLATAAESALWWTGWVLDTAALLVSAGCLWHGARRAHERGRRYAAVALVAAIPVFLFSTWGGVLRDCTPDRDETGSHRGRCVDIGRG